MEPSYQVKTRCKAATNPHERDHRLAATTSDRAVAAVEQEPCWCGAKLTAIATRNAYDKAWDALLVGHDLPADGVERSFELEAADIHPGTPIESHPDAADPQVGAPVIMNPEDRAEFEAALDRLGVPPGGDPLAKTSEHPAAVAPTDPAPPATTELVEPSKPTE